MKFAYHKGIGRHRGELQTIHETTLVRGALDDRGREFSAKLEIQAIQRKREKVC